MGRRIFCLLRGLFFAFFILFLGPSSDAKYKRAMVFSGGGFQTAMFLGMLEGVESLGVHPDVFVASCGGSLAAAIAHVYPDSGDRRKLLESEEFHDFLLSIEFTDQAKLGNLIKFFLELRFQEHFSDKL